MSDAVAVSVRDDFLARYANLRTRAGYAHHLRRYLQWCTTRGLTPFDATRPDIEQYVQYLLAEVGLNDVSTYQSLTPVRGYYRHAYYEGVIDDDPAVHARRPRVRFGARDTLGLDADQLRAFLLAAATVSVRHQAAAYLLGCLALHANEAALLRVENYSRTLRGHRVLEFVGRRGIPACLPLPVPVVRALDAAAADRVVGPLVTTRASGPMSRHNLNHLMRTVARRAGLDVRTMTCDLLRRSAITNALEAGASVRKVQDLARHGEARTTLMYERNRTSLDDHAVYALVAFVAPDEQVLASQSSQT